jgi:hypothetical protein
MRARPTALGVVDLDSETQEWHRAQILRLARHLGYAVIWPPEDSLLPLVDQVREADVDIMIIATPDHLDAITLNAIMSIVSVESACPRLSFACWAAPGRLG